MAKPDGGPAFPTPATTVKGNQGEDLTYLAEPGMMLRDWFAGQALARIPMGTFLIHEETAEAAYELADAMLVEREK